ncbi:MAG: flagellar hook-associated protein FlgK [Bacteriovoracaceae bacterium]|nr:flagellar hook-associated protein FlgK [Bacteriovoracaceae bacterium]
MGANVFTIGSSGLVAAKKQLATTGHNISNVNTEGFTRQRADQIATTPIGSGNITMGTGVDVKSVKRIHDELVEKRFIKSNTEHNYFSERANKLAQVEDVFNEMNGEGMNKLINTFFNTFRELSTQPENDTLRTVVRDKAQMVTHDFNRIHERLSELNSNIDSSVEKNVDDINSLLDRIRNLNVKISQFEIETGETGDLRDQRDLAVKNLSEFMEVQTYSTNKNQFTVNAVGVGTLVVGGTAQKLDVQMVENEFGETSKNITYKNRPGFVLNDKILGGKLGALFEIKRGELNQFRKNLDQLAFNLSESVNAIHRQGYINSSSTKRDPNLPISGINFFQPMNSALNAAGEIKLNQLIKDDPIYIASALEPNSPGDNRVAIAISKLQHEKIGNNGESTLEEDYLKNVGIVGLATSKAKLNEEQTKGMLAQISTLKERVSGVSLDEEAANMIRFQHAYEASAKVISASDEMFNSVLRLLK